jgi:UDP-galactopyranose mutase
MQARPFVAFPSQKYQGRIGAGRYLQPFHLDDQRAFSMRDQTVSERPFLTYWQSGYEGADHINHGGTPQDMNSANGHQGRAREDYRLLQQFGIRTVRESIGWRLVEHDGAFDFSIIEERVSAAREFGIQICWTLLHYGWPQDIDVYGDQFVPRFVRYCTAVAEFLKPFGGPAPVFSPVNEISFTSWGLSVRMFRCPNMDYEHAARDAKRQLVRAAIAGCDAIWAVIPGARMLHCDPLIHIIAHDDEDASRVHAEHMRQVQFEAFDMLSGRRDPELGGAPRYLDLIGVNYYDTNQWEAATGNRMWWHLGDTRRRPLHQMLLEVHERYGRPILLAETGHVGSGRGLWIREVAEQAVMARQRGVDISGICLYPGIDRPDWENADYWHHSGLWDVVDQDGDPQARVLAPAYALGLRQAQALTAHFHRSLDQAAVPAIIVLSHLRWDAAVTRPQHLLTHIARHYRVIYIEEPVAGIPVAGTPVAGIPVTGATLPWMETSHPAPNVTVCRLHTPQAAAVAGSAAGADPWAALQPFARDLARENKDPIVWLYTPAALPLLAAMAPGLVVYDCVEDPLVGPEAAQRPDQEAALLRAADLVFTGSPGLHDARRHDHGQVHYFSSSVDTLHFEQALDRSNGHPSHAGIAGPCLGFHGVIDARFDRALIAAIADAHPEWQVVLVGPLAGIAADDLPQRPNIHYLGPHAYRTWPQFLAKWDVCLVPYLADDAGLAIDRTNVLEYMAAERPIVGTAIRDLQALYGGVIAIAHDHAEFIAACERALALPPAELDSLASDMRAVIAETSWTSMADEMHALIVHARDGASKRADTAATERTAATNQTSFCGDVAA